MSNGDQSGGSWTLLTGHGHVLVEIARNPDARIRDISPVVALTERTVQAIVADLEAAGYLTRTRTGRRTRYTVNHDSLFRHSAQDGHRVGPFLTLLASAGEGCEVAAEDMLQASVAAGQGNPGRAAVRSQHGIIARGALSHGPAGLRPRIELQDTSGQKPRDGQQPARTGRGPPPHDAGIYPPNRRSQQR
jgi:hypothetical protein